MTNENINSIYKPCLLAPAGKDYMWGGTRLKTEYRKSLDMDPLAETWECSTHPEGLSRIASGEWKNRLLTEYLQEHPESLGTHPNSFHLKSGELPILIKFIDAKENLSIQVHPDDIYAMEREHGQLGKTEMWYVMDAAKDTKFIYGFYNDIEKETLRKSMEQGTIEKYLQKVEVHKDDVFFIEAGTVHAIGAGALVAEIQENSNLTYRIYDYERKDKNGNFRQLHQKKALEVIDRRGSNKLKQPMRVLKYRPGSASELLCSCRYFQVYRILINTECAREMVSFQTRENTFHVFLCLAGCGVIFMDDGDSISFFKGDSIFIPANSIGMKIHGKAQLLDISC